MAASLIERNQKGSLSLTFLRRPLRYTAFPFSGSYPRVQLGERRQLSVDYSLWFLFAACRIE
ncbi:MAG TPA: hypothetical protein VMY18_11830 [Acidobacteriota bacterium]|nr:hypothetical protein [Acidobacteriota bacterium]